MILSKEQKKQEEEYKFPYHYLNLLSPLTDVEYVSYLKIVRKILEKNKSNKILDFGCGDGRFELEIDPKKIIGIDYSSKAIGFARAFNPKTKFVIGEITKYNPTSKFDTIVTIETLEHIKPGDMKNVIKALRKSIVTDGLMIVTVPSKNIPLSPKHYQHFDKQSLEKTISPYFKIEKIIGQHKLGIQESLFRTLTIPGRFIELFKFKYLAKRYSDFIWSYYRTHLEISSLNKSKRIIAVCKAI